MAAEWCVQSGCVRVNGIWKTNRKIRAKRNTMTYPPDMSHRVRVMRFICFWYVEGVEKPGCRSREGGTGDRNVQGHGGEFETPKKREDYENP